MEIKIEKGIPIPTKRSVVFPLKQMEIGDSFIVDMKEGTLKAYLSEQNKSEGHVYKFRFNKQEDGRIRVWRVK